jgi:hypothetical protein
MGRTMNKCVFSKDRRYRYVLTHDWRDFSDCPHLIPIDDRKSITWIGLNPSTADENQLDPTLRRVKGFSQAWGFNTFHMVNLFAYRATDPGDMKEAVDPVGPENDHWIYDSCSNSELTIVCWGSHGGFKNRSKDVMEHLSGMKLRCMGFTKEKHPKHPLYLSLKTAPVLFT